MTQATSLVESLRGEASDAELISRVRGGDVDCYGDLFARHREAATRLARQLVPGPDADDLVSEAFVKVMHVLLGGGGPDVAFRAYLLTAVRRLHVDKIRATRKATPTDDLTPYDDGVPFSDTVIAGFEGGAAAKAFASLPERWQLVLWHLEVEGNKPADVAPLLGMTPNSVSALAYRAREGLRQAFLQMHAADLVSSDCQRTHDTLGAYVRNGLSRRDSAKVDEHLEGCRKCTAIYLELTEVNSELAGLLGPLVLGSAATGYLAGGGATVAGGGFLVGGVSWLKDTIGANSQAAVAVGATAVVAVAAVAAVAVSGGDSPPVADAKEPGVEQPADGPAAPPKTKPPANPEPRQPASSPERSDPVESPSTESGPSPAPAPSPDPVDEVPDPSPRPDPAPSPDPSPPGDPGPSEPPPPPPSPPPLPRADVSIVLQQVAGNLAALNLDASVAGIPAGKTSTLRISLGLGVWNPSSLNACPGATLSADGSTLTCTLSANGTYSFRTKDQLIGGDITGTVSVPTGHQDPSTANNTDRLLLKVL